MRQISEDLIKAHADRRFRSEYDYALFEYYRSAKVIAFLERAGVTLAGRVLDAGCGAGALAPALTRAGAVEIVGVDAAAPMVEAASRRYPGHRWLRADLRRLPFPGGRQS